MPVRTCAGPTIRRSSSWKVAGTAMIPPARQLGGGLRPPSEASPRTDCAGEAGARSGTLSLAKAWKLVGQTLRQIVERAVSTSPCLIPEARRTGNDRGRGVRNRPYVAPARKEKDERAASAELDAVLLQGLVAKLQPEPRRLGQRHEAVDDGRALAKQLEPQGIT